MNKKSFFVLMLAAISGSALTLAGNNLLGSKNSRSESMPAHVKGSGAYARAVANNGGPDGGVAADFTYAAEQSMQSVVHIVAVNKPQARNDQERQWYYFFGEPQPRVASGSGVIISRDGYIVTNNHVIEGANEVEVTLSNNKTLKAKVVGADPNTDLAVVKVEGYGELTPIGFANSDDVRVGEWALAVGNPLNLTSTVTAGIISAKGRNINLIDGQRPIESFIQTDAAVNQGNSGGALVNINGDLVGINTAITSPTGSYSGYAFAIPSNLVKKVVNDLMNEGKVRRGKMGVDIATLTDEIIRNEDIKVTEGVYVDGVLPGKGAEVAGIKEGDVIVAVDGIPVKNVAELQEKIGSRNPGDQVRVAINRKGLKKELPLRLSE